MLDSSKPRVILLTGLPSFIARRMLFLLLEKEPQSEILAIVPENKLQRIQLLLEGRRHSSSVRLLVGSTSSIDLGLSGEEYRDAVERVTDIYNLSSLPLNARKKKAHEVNILGTSNLLRFASEAPNLKRLNHLSTAYVAGDRVGVIMESDLDLSQSFRNPFERTHFEAEVLLSSWYDQFPINIYRPSLIVGDSRTGEIDRNRMEGPYMLLRAMLSSPVNIPLPLPGKGENPFNVVPVDWVCQAIHTLSQTDGVSGRVFHLTDPNPLSARAFFQSAARIAKRRPPRVMLPHALTRTLFHLPLLKQLIPRHRHFFDAFNQLTLYNCSNTIEGLQEQGELCPFVENYIANLLDYLSKHSNKISGRRK